MLFLLGVANAFSALRGTGRGLGDGCVWDKEAKQDVCGHGWVLSAWGAYSKCSQPCAGGVQLRTRAVLTAGDPAYPVPDSDAVTCNLMECASLKTLPAGWHLPPPSAHGFASAAYTPAGGFLSEKAEQGACILDKAVSLIEILVSLKHCTTSQYATAAKGQPCYRRAISHLREHLEQCCEGRAHYVMWKSNLQCMRNVGGMIRDWHYLLETKVFLCQRGNAVMCAKLHNGDLISRVLMQGLEAAQLMYKDAEPSDLTAKAKVDLQMCNSQKGCFATITAYVKKFDADGRIEKEDN